MLLRLKQIKGVGRGHEIGFPTINLSVPHDMVLDKGIYASWVTIDGKIYKGALHYGFIPTFNLSTSTMEVHLLHVTDDTVPPTENVDIEIDIVERIREVRKFDTAVDLAVQIEKDILLVDKILR